MTVKSLIYNVNRVASISLHNEEFSNAIERNCKNVIYSHLASLNNCRENQEQYIIIKKIYLSEEESVYNYFGMLLKLWRVNKSNIKTV